jgi:hypothetical protein
VDFFGFGVAPVMSWRARSSAMRASVVAALIWLAMGAPAGGQTGPVDSYTAMVQALCREYAAATVQSGMPADVMFNQCMAQRHCWAPDGSSTYQCEAPGPLTWHGGGY